MSQKKNIHVVVHKDGWAVRSEGMIQVNSVHKTKEEAVLEGQAIALNDKVELIIHEMDVDALE